MPDTPDTISVTAAATAELAADRADLFVTVRGAALFTGDEALKKAREVAQLVADLTALGLTPADIQLRGVSAETASGTLLKSSQAAYSLKVHCARLDQLADLIGAVAAQKNARLERLEWGYPEDEAVWNGLLRSAVRSANAQARAMADELGVLLRGVYALTERQSRHEPVKARGGGDWMGETMARSRAMTSEDLGLAVTHTKLVQVQVSVQYRVSEFTAGSAGPAAGRV